MGHFSGLQEIQNTGTFLPNLEAEPFRFLFDFIGTDEPLGVLRHSERQVAVDR